MDGGRNHTKLLKNDFPLNDLYKNVRRKHSLKKTFSEGSNNLFNKLKPNKSQNKRSLSFIVIERKMSPSLT